MNTRPYYRSDREYESPIGIYRVAKGWTLKELSDRSSVAPGDICSFQNGMTSPLYLVGDRAGKIKPQAKQICDALKIDIEDAFPRYFCRIRNLRNDLTGGQVAHIAHGKYGHDPLVQIIRHENNCVLKKGLSRLPKRTADIVSRRFGLFGDEETLHAIAADYKLSSAMIRIIEARGLRELRRFLKKAGLSTSEVYYGGTGRHN